MNNTTFPGTHLIYVEEVITGKTTTKLLSRYRSVNAALEALDVILSQNRSYDAQLQANEVRITKGERLMKRWVMEAVEKEKELNFTV